MTVYFLQLGDGGPIKIGYSTRMKKRHFELACLLPWDTNILASFDQWTKQDERLLQDFFKPYRMRGEWFRPSREIFKFLKAPKRPSESLTGKTASSDKMLHRMTSNAGKRK